MLGLGAMALAAAACSEGFESDASLERSPVEIRISPESALVSTGPDGGQSVQFVAEVAWDDGTTEDLELAEWAVSNQSAGEIDEDGYFTPSSLNGGVTWVTARLAGVEGTSTVTVRYEEQWVEEGADASLVSATSSTEAADLWLYPEDGVNIPRNTPSIVFQWSDEGLAEPIAVWRATFKSDIVDIEVYTDAEQWTADEETWQRLAATNAGGTIDIELVGATESGVLYEAEPASVQVNRMDADGSIYYWSTSAEGIMAIPYGGTATDYYTTTTSGHCTACHAVSSQGYMALTYDGGNGELGLYDMDGEADVVGSGGGINGNFKTFSPDGELLLATYAGALMLYDGVTGEYLTDVATEGTVSHVEWSPLGDRVALTLTDDHTYDWVFSNGRLAMIEYLGDQQFSEAKLLYSPDEGYSAYYPAFSPDGEWLAFNISTGDSYDDSDATLYVIDPDGGSPIELFNANMTGGLTNSWPKWGPLPDDDILWLAFSSKRDYGAYASGYPQIWLSAFDPEAAAAGEDPSWPAFWLPGQDHEQSNHTPVWPE